MDKRFWISGIVLTVAAMVLGFIIHGVLLAADYAALGPVMRTADASAHDMPFTMLADLAIGFAAIWIYRQSFAPSRSAIGQMFLIGVIAAVINPSPGAR